MYNTVINNDSLVKHEQVEQQKKKKMENDENEVREIQEKTVVENNLINKVCDVPVNVNTSNSGASLSLSPTVQQRFFHIKKLVLDAIAAHHTFMIYGKAKVIREGMLQRGWCEKFYRKNVDPHLNVESNPLQLLSGIGNLKDQQSEKLLISRMLSNHTVDFLWNTGMDWQGWPSQENKTTIFNRYCRAGFTSKIGLCSNVKQMQWYYEADVSHTLFPRCYNLSQSDQMHAFIEDFRLTACLNLLKWLVNKINTEGESSARSQTGTIPIKVLEFAIKRCTDYIDSQSHEDIDQEAERVWSYQWDRFIDGYYKIVQGQAIFVRNNAPFHNYVLASSHILQTMKKYWPQLDMDGIMNIWIVKPGNKSRGRGIMLMNKLQDILAKISPTNRTDTRYVVQKYIERPLLIYDTKFDIRQWFLITRTLPLTIWIYKESYLRFCTQPFTLADFHESIHLCNYSIQCKYTNNNDRNPALPVDNMWDAATFKQFLKDQGHGNVWDDLIYPGMKQGLIGSLLASQEAMDRRKNSFELYGADFMLMEDFSVWLIEINSHPDMSNSTSVTTRLCRQVMEDTLKVVVDLREDKNVDTGQFELIYKQKMPTCQPYLGAALSLQGTRIPICDKKPSVNTQESKLNQNLKSPVINQTKETSSSAHSHIGPIIVDLIEELDMQLDLDMNAYFDKESVKLKPMLPIKTAPERLKTIPTLMDAETETKDGNIDVIPDITATNSKSQKNSVVLNRKTGTKRVFRKKPIRNQNIESIVNVKSETLKTRQDLIRKVINLPKQTYLDTAITGIANTTQENVKGKNAISSTTKEAITEHKQSISLPSVSAVNNNNKITSIITDKKKIKNIIKKRSYFSKNKFLLDITDMYAVGLSVNK